MYVVSSIINKYGVVGIRGMTRALMSCAPQLYLIHQRVLSTPLLLHY
jgi:hypothetical protein